MISLPQLIRTRMNHVYATLRVVILVVALAATPGQHVAAQTSSTKEAPHPPHTSQTQEGAAGTNRIILKFKDPGTGPPVANEQAMRRLRDRSGIDLQYFRSMSGEAHVLRLPERLPMEQVRSISETLMTLPEVEYAEPDLTIYPFRTPNDPEYGNQWHYYDTWGINAPAAWDLTTGLSSITIAVIDTGITDHPDLSRRTVAGYDFISDAWTANDGNGRDNNPSDPGDWVGPGECWAGSLPQDSSWHGTHVAGTIGAISNNGIGVAGINWQSKILPVRVLGRCGGSLSDLVDAMRWAAGLPVPGVPENPNPARVLNLSLGGEEPCGASLQNAVNSVTSAGAVIIVAAGNSLADASGFTPANCSGVITVAATDESGDLALYSNYGSTVEISAPGGGFFPACSQPPIVARQYLLPVITRIPQAQAWLHLM